MGRRRASCVPESQRLAAQLLEDAGVALLSGEGFGAHGDRHLRISYAKSRAQLDLALDRIREFLGALAPT